MYSCPGCGFPNAAGLDVCRCGADLSLLLNLSLVADAWFNKALDALAEGQAGQALEWLSACCAASPTDAAARRAQAKVWAQLGRTVEARDALEQALLLDPTSAEAKEIRCALDAAERRGAPMKGGKRAGRSQRRPRTGAAGRPATKL
jgi:tetratricopeptide (TPR) repeat protein